jgi:hypothetical protein
MIKIRFTKSYQSYVANKTCTFTDDIATALIDLGVAELCEKSIRMTEDNKMISLAYENKGL